MNDIRIICGRNIARLRKERGFNQYDLAAEVGLSKTTIANYEQYVSFPGANNLMLIADVLGVKPFELLMEIKK